MQYDTYDARTWLEVIRLLLEHGFTVVAQDRENGTVTVRVPR